MSQKTRIYIHPKCSSCKKALSFLESNEIPFSQIDITQKSPSKNELKVMLKTYENNVKKLFNTSGNSYKEGNFKNKLPQLSIEQAVEALGNDGMLVKRPFLLSDSISLVGFKEEEWIVLV